MTRMIFGKKKAASTPSSQEARATPTPNAAYDSREARDAKLCARLGAPLEPWMLAIRKRNYEEMMANPKMLRDIGDVESVTVATCVCGKPMVITFTGNGKTSSLWLDCCSNGTSAARQSVPARSLSLY